MTVHTGHSKEKGFTGKSKMIINVQSVADGISWQVKIAVW